MRHCFSGAARCAILDPMEATSNTALLITIANALHLDLFTLLRVLLRRDLHRSRSRLVSPICRGTFQLGQAGSRKNRTVEGIKFIFAVVVLLFFQLLYLH